MIYTPHSLMELQHFKRGRPTLTRLGVVFYKAALAIAL